VLSQLANEKVSSGKTEAEALKALKLNHNKMVAEKDKDISTCQAEVTALKESMARLKAEKAAVRAGGAGGAGEVDVERHKKATGRS